MLADNSAKPEPEYLSDFEREQITNLKQRMLRTRCDLPALANETGVELTVLRMLTRIGTDFDEVPDALSGAQKDEAFQKIAEWIDVIESADDTILRVERRMAAYHTISGVARQLDLDPAALGQLISGATEGWNAHEHAYKRTMLKRLRDWAERDAESDARSLAQTPTFIAIQCDVENTLSVGGTLAMTGEPGIGKSVTLKDFCHQYPKTRNQSGAVYIAFEAGDNTEKAILEVIVTGLYQQGLVQTMSGDPKRIIKQALGPGDIVLFDEVQFAFSGANRGGDLFHSLHDTTGVPFVFMGNYTTTGALLDDKKQPYAALVNRGGVRPHMQTTNEDVAVWMAWQGFESAELIRAAQKIGARPGQSGGLRTLAYVIRNAEKMHPGKKLTKELLMSTASYYGKSPTHSKKEKS